MVMMGTFGDLYTVAIYWDASNSRLIRLKEAGGELTKYNETTACLLPDDEKSDLNLLSTTEIEALPTVL